MAFSLPYAGLCSGPFPPPRGAGSADRGAKLPWAHGCISRGHQGVIMSKDTDTPPADVMSALIEMRGLKRTYELYPEIVATAFERGRRPIASFPQKFSAVTEPAGRFTALPGSDE